MEEIKYKCFNCNNYETDSYNNMRKHLFKKSVCKKNKVHEMSTDHIFVNSILPYTNDETLIEISYLENSDILFNNKKELFEIIDKIYNENSNICSICNKEVETKYELQKHMMLDCLYDKYTNNEILKFSKNRKYGKKTKTDETPVITQSTHQTTQHTNQEINIPTNTITNTITNTQENNYHITTDNNNEQSITIGEAPDHNKQPAYQYSTKEIILQNCVFEMVCRELLKKEINPELIKELEKNTNSGDIQRDATKIGMIFSKIGQLIMGEFNNRYYYYCFSMKKYPKNYSTEIPNIFEKYRKTFISKATVI